MIKSALFGKINKKKDISQYIYSHIEEKERERESSNSRYKGKYYHLSSSKYHLIRREKKEETC